MMSAPLKGSLRPRASPDDVDRGRRRYRSAQFLRIAPMRHPNCYEKRLTDLNMILEAGCTMTVDAADKSAVVLILRPQSGLGQEVKHTHLSIEPPVNLYEFHDAFGNLQQRTMLGQGRSIITSTCTVDTPDEIASEPDAPFTLIQNLPDDVIHYLL